MGQSRFQRLRARFQVLDSLVHRARGTQDLRRLVRSGLGLGRDVFIADDVYIDMEWAWLISIGDHTSLGPRAMILAHDAGPKRGLGYSLIRRVRIGSHVFVGAGAIILPGVTVGDHAIIGAGAVVRRDVTPGTVVAGNPAEAIGRTDAYISRHRQQFEASDPRGLTSADRECIVDVIGDRALYVR